MALVLIAVVITFVAAFTLRGNGARPKAKRGDRQVGYLRDEIQLDSSNVPEFRSSWRNMR